MIKYRTGGWSRRPIVPIEVERETASSVWINGNRHGKMTDYHQYWDTFYDAHAYLIANAERAVDSCRLSLERAKGELGNIRGLKEEC